MEEFCNLQASLRDLIERIKGGIISYEIYLEKNGIWFNKSSNPSIQDENNVITYLAYFGYLRVVHIAEALKAINKFLWDHPEATFNIEDDNISCCISTSEQADNLFKKNYIGFELLSKIIEYGHNNEI
jgi:hypothetical protein